MEGISRRELFKAGGASFFAASAFSSPFYSGSESLPGSNDGVKVYLRGDGLSLSPGEYIRLLSTLAEETKIEADHYSNGGAVETMEKSLARLLGKERAVFFPTGTLANHVAIRELAGEKKRALVQERSHVYNDSGDCVQRLTGINLLPLGANEATFTTEEVERVLAHTESGRVRTGIGVISIESPVRRKLGRVFDYEEMKRVAAFAGNNGIKLHLDGARIFIASAYSCIPVSEYASLFDTVYVSLYKYFNAPFGAVLAGPSEMLDDVFHIRRMFGGGLPQVWACAVIVSHFLEGFLDRFKAATEKFEVLLKEISEKGGFRVERIPNGTNLCMLRWDRAEEPEEFKTSLEKQGVFLSEPSTHFKGFILAANETLNRIDPLELADIFIKNVR